MTESIEDFEKLRAGGNRIFAGIALLVVVVLGLWWIFGRDPGHVRITQMAPGAFVTDGTSLACWLILEFESEPDGDPRDLVVVFDGEALVGGEQRFDWAHIASRDVQPQAVEFRNEATSPDRAPALGDVVKVQVSLRLLPHVPESTFALPLTATVYWGGEAQDRERKTLGHLYTSG